MRSCHPDIIHHIRKLKKKKKPIIILRDINNTGSDDQESSSAESYPAVKAKRAGAENWKDFPSHQVQWQLPIGSQPFLYLALRISCLHSSQTLSGEATWRSSIVVLSIHLLMALQMSSSHSPQQWQCHLTFY